MIPRHCSTCRCFERKEPKRFAFIVDGQRYETDQEYVPLGYIISCVNYAYGRAVIWLRDGGLEEDVRELAGNSIRYFSTVNTPRFLTVPPGTYY